MRLSPQLKSLPFAREGCSRHNFSTLFPRALQKMSGIYVHENFAAWLKAVDAQEHDDTFWDSVSKARPLHASLQVLSLRGGCRF